MSNSTDLFWRAAGALVLFLLAAAPSAQAQIGTETPPVIAGAKPVTIEHVTLHAPSLEGNLEGDNSDRELFVLLPPGYVSHPERRYPVLYALHGYSIGAEQWMHEIHAPQTIEGAFANGAAEMIVVLPDSKTVHNGSLYSSSATTGDFEAFIAHDLVTYIDSHYRTLPDRASRGLAGHSMGGYGVARIGMKHADIFGALYLMSPCCLSPRRFDKVDPNDQAALDAIKSPADSEKLPFQLRAQLASAAAWSPNPHNPPLYLDLPIKDGVARPEILEKWAANAPLDFADQYVGALRRFRAIAIDVGDQDSLKTDAERLHKLLDSYKIANSFEIYSGTHTSRVAFRIQDQVMMFFARNLDFGLQR